jgi:hypothetical protein
MALRNLTAVQRFKAFAGKRQFKVQGKTAPYYGGAGGLTGTLVPWRKALQPRQCGCGISWISLVRRSLEIIGQFAGVLFRFYENAQ